MPTKIYLRGGAALTVKGETKPTALLNRGLGRKAGIALNGHEVEFRAKDILALEFQSEAEYQAEIRKQAEAAKEAAEASHCRRCGTNSPRTADFCSRCGSALVKKAEPSRIIPVGQG